MAINTMKHGTYKAEQKVQTEYYVYTVTINEDDNMTVQAIVLCWSLTTLFIELSLKIRFMLMSLSLSANRLYVEPNNSTRMSSKYEQYFTPYSKCLLYVEINTRI